MIIEISALDTLIFQDGKPFDKSGDNWGSSLALPTPLTIYGAIRAAYFANNPNELSKANENDDPTTDLKINAITLQYKDSLILHTPKDCVEFNKKVTVLDLKENTLTNSPLKYIFSSTHDVESLDKTYLTKTNFKRYLSNKEIRSFENEENLITKESKIGIGLNRKTKTTEDGLLYRVEMLRYKDLKIVVDFDGLELEKSGLIRIGGEAKGATYQQIDSLEFPQVDTLSSNSFKLYLLTPALFEDGWFPNWIDKDNDFIGEYKGFKLKLVASSIGKYQSIGGFDMKKREPKEMMKAVPSGSVYYFEILKGDNESVINSFHLTSISDRQQKEGYGIAIVGDIE